MGGVTKPADWEQQADKAISNMARALVVMLWAAAVALVLSVIAGCFGLLWAVLYFAGVIG